MARGNNNFKDIKGKKFGRLTVIKRGPTKISPSGQYKTYWWCQCSCGNPELSLVPATCLNSGRTLSCGCLQKERASEAKKKENRYEFIENIVIGYTYDGSPFYLNKEDYNRVRPYSWYKASNGYISARIDGKIVKMHRLIMKAGSDKLVDHINHDKSDNRRSNLRIVSHSQNQQNMKTPKHNSSGVKGVSWSNRKQSWIVQIKINGKLHFLGSYRKKEDAISARKAAEEKYFGQYSYENSIAAVPTITQVVTSKLESAVS